MLRELELVLFVYIRPIHQTRFNVIGLRACNFHFLNSIWSIVGLWEWLRWAMNVPKVMVASNKCRFVHKYKGVFILKCSSRVCVVFDFLAICLLCFVGYCFYR